MPSQLNEKEIQRKSKNSRSTKRPPKRISEKYLYNAGLAYLQRFPTSTQHFRLIMTRKINRSCIYHKDQDREECFDLLNKTIEKFIDLGFLNDQSYTEGLISSLRRRGLSERAIITKIRQKGISPEQIRNALLAHDKKEYNNQGDIYAALILARKRKLPPFQQREPQKSYEQSLAILGRAGFSYDTATKILSMKLKIAEEIINHQY